MNTSSGGSAANGRPRRKAALKADKSRKDADAATTAAAKAAESSDDDAAAAEESDDDVFADESDADDDEPAPKAGSKRKASSGKAGSKRKASSGKAGSKRKADGSGGGGKRNAFYGRKAAADAKYPPQAENRETVEPSSKTLKHLDAAGSKFEGGHGDVLDKLISKGDLVVIHLTWDGLVDAKEADDTMAEFWEV